MIYTWIHFLHVLGALGIAATYAIEAAGLVGLRRSLDADEARVWFRTRRWVLKLGPVSLFVVLASGVYSVLVGWGWVGWIQASMTGLLSLAAIGGVLTGIPSARLALTIERAAGRLPDDVRGAIRSPVFTVSLSMRIAITTAIAFLMVRKPERMDAFLVIGAAAAGGGLFGWALGARRARPTVHAWVR
jgi:hypothetical protein